MAINLHPGQTEIFEALFTKKTARNVVGVCSRGWGKSYFAGAAAATPAHAAATAADSSCG